MEPNSIQVELAWHQRHPLLAVGAYSEEKGGYISVMYLNFKTSYFTTFYFIKVVM